jgi:hypothetical protein
MATSEDFAHIKVKKLLSMERKYHSLHWKFKSGNSSLLEGNPPNVFRNTSPNVSS